MIQRILDPLIRREYLDRIKENELHNDGGGMIDTLRDGMDGRE